MRKTKPEYEKAILSAKKQFIAVAGKEAWERESKLALDRYFNFVIHALKRYDAPNASSLTPMQASESESIRQAMLNIAYAGITINPIFREAYLSVRDGNCFLDFTYKGLIKIATMDGAISHINAGVCYKWDKVDCRQGTGAYLHITPGEPTVDPDKLARDPKMIWEYLRSAYSIVTLPNGKEDFVLLPKFKLLKTWELTDKDPINSAWPEEWIKKTAIRYHSKTLPTAQRLVTAVSVMNEHEGVSKKKRKPESQIVKRMKK